VDRPGDRTGKVGRAKVRSLLLSHGKAGQPVQGRAAQGTFGNLRSPNRPPNRLALTGSLVPHRTDQSEAREADHRRSGRWPRAVQDRLRSVTGQQRGQRPSLLVQRPFRHRHSCRRM